MSLTAPQPSTGGSQQTPLCTGLEADYRIIFIVHEKNYCTAGLIWWTLRLLGLFVIN
jgi:hypothetical protein